jgi:hypothetical protein
MNESGGAESFPPKVEVPKSFVREHERLELEAEHLREQLDEYKRYVNYLREQIEEDEDEVIHLEDLDGEGREADWRGEPDEPSFRLG